MVPGSESSPPKPRPNTSNQINPSVNTPFVGFGLVRFWPLLVTTKENFYTVVMTVSRQANVVDAVPSWNLLMAMAMLAMLPPVAVVVFMQRLFVRGLVETEK